jgi:hypothetical protein
MKTRHLTEEAILGLAGKRLTDKAQRAVEEHLAECAECRKEYAEFEFAHSVVGRVAEIGYQEALWELPREAVIRPKREFAFPWKPILAITFGCVCVIALLFYPRIVPVASAAELLSSAMQYEDHTGDVKAFRIQVSGQTCATGQASERMASFDSSVRCGRALQHIHNSQWGHGNPLSARTYATWRESLHRRRDRVTKREKSWEINTTTDEGTIHTATLELRSSDYHTTKLTLDFADNEEVSISEDTEPLPTPGDIASKTSTPQPQFVDSPGDILEVQAWKVLHQLNADSGWEAVILRSGPEVRVKASVHDDPRREELTKAFAAYPDVVLDIHPSDNPGDVSDVFPSKAQFAEDAPALATGWLKQQFPDPDQRADFSNSVLRSSRAILGRAFIIDRLKQRRTALAHCSCAKDLAALVVTEKRALGVLENGLFADVEPMFGSSLGTSSNVLTLGQARDLDGTLHELLWRSSATTGGTFDMRVEQVRKLLAQN